MIKQKLAPHNETSTGSSTMHHRKLDILDIVEAISLVVLEVTRRVIEKKRKEIKDRNKQIFKRWNTTIILSMKLYIG